METNISYDQEEVQELFDVVFKLSAKDIDDKLKKVSNRPEIAKRRWFWELLQNAKDSVKPTEKVSVNLLIANNETGYYVEFKHNGNPFRYQDAKNLIFPYSDKDDEQNSDKSGKFGTGFLATHILSRQIDVKGIFLKDNNAFDFEFTLDRRANEKTEIAESIGNTWQTFRKNKTHLPQYNYSQNNYETFFRYNLDDDSLNIAINSIDDIAQSLPFVLAFIPKVEEVKIENQIRNLCYKFQLVKNTKLTENLTEFIIIKKIIASGIEHEDLIRLIVCSDGKLDLAIQIKNEDEKVELISFQEHQPLLFCGFPLIGASEFKFPVIVNSTSFVPKEERDGIWLESTGYGLINQPLFERVVDLFNSLCEYASINNLVNTHLLFASLKESISLNDFNAKWFKEKIQDELKKNILAMDLVYLNSEGKEKAQNVNFPYHEKQEIRLEIWSFLKDAIPSLVTKKADVGNWYEVIWGDWQHKATLSTLTKFIAGFKNVDTLGKQLNKDKSGTLKWLDEYAAFISNNDSTLLNIENCKILPDQFGNFKKKDELWLDDDTIPDDLKELLPSLAKLSKKIYDWRTDMLEKKIFLELPTNRTRTISVLGSTIVDIVKDLLREENPSNDLKDLFSRLLVWLNEHPDIAKNYFKGIRTDSLLYKTASDSKIKYVTQILERDRSGEIGIEQLVVIDDPKKIALLNDPQLEAKLKLGEKYLNDPDIEIKLQLGEQSFADFRKEKEEFQFKKSAGDVFETLFKQLIQVDNRFEIKKVEGEEDFIITNKDSKHEYYIELKSIKGKTSEIEMTHRQVKKAYRYPNNYVLCVIPHEGNLKDEAFFRNNALFDSTIGTKLSLKIQEALSFENDAPGVKVLFEDDFLKAYHKYRYTFLIDSSLWGKDNFENFIEKLS